MGLWNWIKTQATGVDEDAEMERARQLEAAADAQAQISAAKYGDEWLVAYNAHDAGDDVYLNGSEYNQGFEEGWEEGKQNITSTVRGGFRVVGDGLSSVLTGIPWWIWAAGLLALLAYLGAFRGVLAERRA